MIWPVCYTMMSPIFGQTQLLKCSLRMLHSLWVSVEEFLIFEMRPDSFQDVTQPLRM